MEGKDYLLKLVVVGNSGVGKSSMLSRYTEDHFDDKFVSTIGVDFKMKTIEVGDKKVLLQIWDTGGQERFRTITHTYYRGAHGVLIAYSTTDERSFESVKGWLADVQSYTTEDIICVLAATKKDLNGSRAVTFAEGKKLADDLGMQFIETSAKTSEGLEELFYKLAQTCIKHEAVGLPNGPTDNLDLQGIPVNKNKGGWCCT